MADRERLGGDWRLIDEVAAYRGMLTVLRRRFVLPDGRATSWDVLAPSDMVAVVALTAEGRFLVVRQFRAGPLRQLHELPGGYVEAGEHLCDAAARELLEETGFVPGCLAVLGSSWVAPDAALRLHTVLALDCSREHAPDPDPDEGGPVLQWSASHFRAHARRGDFTDQASAYLALDLLGLLLSDVPHGDDVSAA